MDSMEKLKSHLASRIAELRTLKNKGTKIVGYFPGDYMPDEMVYASGAVPICLNYGGEPRAIRAAQPMTMRFLCPFVKAQLGERLLNQHPYYHLVDMLVVPITCAHMRKAADMWQYYTNTEIFRLGIPREWDSEGGLEYYLEMLRQLKQRLERLTGNKIKDGEIERAIGLYNKMRNLLKAISLSRKASPSPISTLDFIKLNHASFYADPDSMVDILAHINDELQTKGEQAADLSGPRLLLSGPNIAYGDYKVLELAEESGGQIVAEELCEGIRYYWEGVESDSDVLVALANKYLKKRNPCAFMTASAKERLNFVMNLVREFSVEGIIWYQLLYCETYDIESYFLARKMEEVGIPVLILQSDYDVLDRGQLKTRIEAFIEMISSKGVP